VGDSEAIVRQILTGYGTITVVGASANPGKVARRLAAVSG
jgi:predicted CoA-binding protein